MEPPFNESLYNEVLGTTNDFLQPGQNYSKMYGIEPRFNDPLHNEVLDITNDFLQAGQNHSKMYGTEPLFNEILVIMNTIHKRKREIDLDITNKSQHVMKHEYQTNQQG